MNTLYQDRLVAVTDSEMVFRCYYFPFGGARHVALNQIERIETRPPSLAFGSWRLWGGGPRTWFPLDLARPSRDTIFVAWLRGGFIRIGFTVERSREFMQMLQARGLLPAPTVG